MTSTASSILRRAFLSASIAAALATTAHADVTMEERMSVSGEGLMQMMNMTGTTVTTISGNRARTDSNLQFQSGLVRTFAGGAGDTSEIVQLDQDKIYTLNNKKKTYEETTFAARRAQLQQAMEQMQKSQAQQQQSTSGVDESQCEWQAPKSDVTRGEKASLAGYQSERVTVTATRACKDRKTGQVCEFGLVLDQWLAPAFEASSEATAYQRAYAEKLGLNAAASRDFAERAQSMFGGYAELMNEIASKTRDLKGYPMKASFSLAVGGPQCQSTQQTQAAGGPAPPPSIGGALGGALGGMFGKKKEPAQAQPTTPPPAMPNGLMRLMTIGNELVSVNRNPANPQSFDVPAGFKKR
jgi:hypothetical protein